LRCVETKVGVSNRVSSFVLPMGATVNMDGTALYECVGVIFIAQVMGFHLDVAAQATVVLTALLASIGAAGIPSAGLVMIFIVTEAINLTGPQVSLIVGTMLAIDRPLDMLRTMVNVTSDSVGAAIIARSEGESDVNSVSTPWFRVTRSWGRWCRRGPMQRTRWAIGWE
jgi:proton glutamate symport protein